MSMKRRLAVFLAVLQVWAWTVPVFAAEREPTDPNDPLLWEPDLPEFDGPMPRTGETEDTFRIIISFTGDMLLASLHGQRAAGNFLDYAAKQEPEYFLQHVQPFFQADDFTVVNLENVLTDRNLTPKEKSTDPAYWFRGPTANTDILTSSGVEAVSLANNHTGDYGSAGYQDTLKAVSAAGLEYGGNDRTFYLEKNGYRVAVICHGLWNEGQAGAILQRLRTAEKDSDFQVVFYHGGAEGVHAPEAWRVRASRRLVDGGADLVLGNHPHVLQPREVYKEREIVYSLGNFCFGGSRGPENRTVIYQLILQVENGELVGTSSELIPCYVHTGGRVNNYCPAPIDDEGQRRKVLDFMDGKAKLPY
ncbi:MAG: CapA family protein [Oscillibacter sp.]|nr:CapA family protein [Oscillibacter sp.]